MKYSSNKLTWAIMLATGGPLAWGWAGLAQAPEGETVQVTSQATDTDSEPVLGNKMIVKTQVKKSTDDPSSPDGLPGQHKVIIQTLEPDGGQEQARETTWLGLAAEESPEVVSAQLGLSSGEGLTVNYIAKDSPAAKADFHKNDVLVELDGQMLVDPLQLRKLVQMHGEGDTIKLTFFRAGHKQTLAVKLGKRAGDPAFDREEGLMPGGLPKMQFRFQDFNGQLHNMDDALARAGLDKEKMKIEIQSTLEQTTKAIQDAMRRATSNVGSLDKVKHELEALARNGLEVDKEATVTVRTKHDTQRTMVKTDDSGTIIYEAGAKQHLTARDKDGKTLFEGDIDTPAEQAQVPKEVWEKAQPMIQGDDLDGSAGRN